MQPGYPTSRANLTCSRSRAAVPSAACELLLGTLLLAQTLAGLLRLLLQAPGAQLESFEFCARCAAIIAGCILYRIFHLFTPI